MTKKQRVINFVEEIQCMFSIQNFERKITFFDVASDNTQASFVFDEEYQRIDLKIYPIFFDQTLEEQRKVLLHELCHSFTNPQKQLTDNIIVDGLFVGKNQIHETCEKSTSQIENALDALLQGKLKYAVTAYNNYLK